MAIENPAPLRILAFFAHPDDETMFLGGTLAYLAQRGAQIHFLCATRGEGGEMGDPPVCAREQLGAVRENELRCAAEALGGSSVDFLGYEDPLVGPQGELYEFSTDLSQVAAEIRNYISSLGPQAVLTHGPEGEYGHPAHIQAHQAMMEALAGMDHHVESVYSPSWLSRDSGEFTPAPSIVVETSPWITQKIAAVQCHRSQHGLFLRHGSARAGRPVEIPEMVRSREGLCRLHPENGSADGDRLGSLLREIKLPAGV